MPRNAVIYASISAIPMFTKGLATAPKFTQLLKSRTVLSFVVTSFIFWKGSGKMQTLSVDVETYSAADLLKVGAYRYADDPSFEILLFAYSIDGGAVKVIDLANGEKIPSDLMYMLRDPNVIKWAHNASFERACLSKYLGKTLDPRQWRCTMIWSAYLGLPLSLSEVGRVLKLEEQKIKEGKRLISLFCKPDRNGHRIYPTDRPFDWGAFIEYNRRDVETEMAIADKLSAFPVPDSVWEEYALDCAVNGRGVLIDRKLAENAVEFDNRHKSEVLRRMVALTGLQNPNSVAQLKEWLAAVDVETPSLGKTQVKELLGTVEHEAAAEVLRLRQLASKSSVKKYEKMLKTVCSDGRARGMFQFYGSHCGRACLTGEHEVLTPNGWVRLDEWKGGCIACWNENSFAVSFQKSEQREYEYDGDMIVLEGARISQISTPDHKMRVKKRYDLPWTTITAAEMKSRHCIPFTGIRQKQSAANEWELRTLIMIQADGHFTGGGDLEFNFFKLRKVERCKTLLRKCGLSYAFTEYENRGYHYKAFKIPYRALPLWIRGFRDKTFGWWLLDENPAVVLNELEHWDGYRGEKSVNSMQYCTTNKQNSDIIQALATTNGYAATILLKNNSQQKENWSDAYVVNIWFSPGEFSELRNPPKSEYFSGKVYCATTPTGYFMVRRNGRVWVTGNSGRLIQLQNLPRGTLHGDGLKTARETVKSGDYDFAEMAYDDLPETLSSLVRTALIPREEFHFSVADYSAIECRVLAWLAGEEWVLAAFRQGEDIYKTAAAKMYKCDYSEVDKEKRQVGKVSILAGGYGGGIGAFKAFGADRMGLSDSEITKIVKDYRENNPNIVRYWYALENACINAINGGGETKLARGIKIRCERAMLIITLPSGRELFYQKPQIVNNRFGKKSIGYWGVGSTEKAGVRKWSLVETYGGRLAENCLGGDTLVLTDNGWKKITDVLLSDLLWNGKKWVTHEGVIYKGIQKTICIEGIRATPDHKILTKRGWENASSYKRHNRRSPRLPDGFRLCGVRRTEKPVALSMRRQRHSYLYKKRFSEKSQLRLSVENSYSKCKSNPWYAPAPRILGMEVSVRPLSLADTSGLEKLWRTRYNSLQTLGRKFREFLGRYGGGLQTRSYTRQNKQQRKLRAVKLLLGYSQNSKQQQTLQYNNRYTSRKNDGGTGGRYFGNRTNNHSLSDRTRRVGGAFIRQTRRSEQVFDILNCKDGHCFTVMGETGISLLSHNCTQAVARDLLYFSLRTLAENGEEVVCHIHDECVVETKSSAERISALMSLAPDWADGLPLRAEGYECEFYEKQ